MLYLVVRNVVSLIISGSVSIIFGILSSDWSKKGASCVEAYQQEEAMCY